MKLSEKSLQLKQLAHRIESEEKKFQAMKGLTQNLENELATVEKKLEAKIAAAEVTLNSRDFTKIILSRDSYYEILEILNCKK